jgi:hypothetical protein
MIRGMHATRLISDTRLAPERSLPPLFSFSMHGHGRQAPAGRRRRIAGGWHLCTHKSAVVAKMRRLKSCVFPCRCRAAGKGV